jgi:hypothetical protein
VWKHTRNDHYLPEIWINSAINRLSIDKNNKTCWFRFNILPSTATNKTKRLIDHKSTGNLFQTLHVCMMKTARILETASLALSTCQWHEIGQVVTKNESFEIIMIKFVESSREYGTVPLSLCQQEISSGRLTASAKWIRRTEMICCVLLEAPQTISCAQSNFQSWV